MTNVSKNYISLKDHLGLRLLSTAEGHLNLFFFPHVGGNSLSFKLLAEQLPKDWQIWSVDPPGHGWARGELILDFDQMINLYFEELKSFLKGKFFLFGHSLGGIIAYKLTQKLENAGITPQRLFISASPVPHRIIEYEYLKEKTDKQLIETLSQYGGIPDSILNDEAFALYFAKSIRADVSVFLSARVDRCPVLKTPITVYYSKDDKFLKYEDVYEWDIYGYNVEFNEVDGNHLYIQSHHCQLAEKIIKRMSES